MPTTPPLVLVDGHNLLHRAAFGFPARIRSRSGRDITCVFGFFALLRAAARSAADRVHVVVAFDGQDGSVERRNVLPSYKPPVLGDEAVFADLPAIRDGLRTAGVTCVEDTRFEADDVIATLVAAYPDRRRLVMSTDKDFYQLLDPNTAVLNTTRRADARLIGPDDVRLRHHVGPDQWCDFRALTGDPSDKIPGVRGIGPVGAARLLADGVHLEDLDRLGRLTGRPGAAIRQVWEDVLLWRSVMRLRSDLPVAVCELGPPVTLPPAPEVVGRLGLWD